MILIADGGSTKTNWCLLNEAGRKIYFNTEGYNPYFVSQDYITKSLRETLPPHIEGEKITEIFYYGAGCSTDVKRDIVRKGIGSVFTGAEIVIGHDLLAACRALLGNSAGFAAILGTGTNTCLYNGKDITLNIDSLAYYLGDEGSGSYLGKQVLGDYIRGYMPATLSKIFDETYNMTVPEILDRIYTQPLPNRFCASFSKFLYDNKERHEEYVHKIVDKSFTDFFANLVSHYPDYKKYELNCVGSVAYNFRDRLSLVADRYEMGVGKIVKSPIDDLVAYHASNKVQQA